MRIVGGQGYLIRYRLLVDSPAFKPEGLTGFCTFAAAASPTALDTTALRNGAVTCGKQSGAFAAGAFEGIVREDLFQ